MRMKPCYKAIEGLCRAHCGHEFEHDRSALCLNKTIEGCPPCEPVEVITHTAAEVIRELERMLTPEYADNDEGIIEHTGDWILILLDSQLKRLKEKYLNQEDK